MARRAYSSTLIQLRQRRERLWVRCSRPMWRMWRRRLQGSATDGYAGDHVRMRRPSRLHLRGIGQDHRKRSETQMPFPFVGWRALAWLAEMLPSPLVTRNQVELMQVDNVASPEMLGWRPRNCNALGRANSPRELVGPLIHKDSARNGHEHFTLRGTSLS